jgi:hypothetical protein
MGSSHSAESVLRVRFLLVAGKREFLLADGEIAGVHDFRDDVDTVLEFEVDEIRLAVFDFVDGRLLGSRALDVGERVIVIDR